ncbi:MAG: FeoA domain-containing protein [Desulfovibrionaceae bacterium]|nr:FeoA domain-containing protein [Desulfovibrionaceae bacterium]
MRTVNLREMAKNQRARVISVDAEGELGRRIRDMGLLPGIELSVAGRAPLKDPVALRVKGYTLTLRNNEADYITVQTMEE